MSLLWKTAVEEPVTYYHGTSGTDDDDLDEVSPSSARGAGSIWGAGSGSSPDHAYATTSQTAAWDYAVRRHQEEGWSWSRPKVYRVSPTGPVEEDPHYDEHGSNRGNWVGDVRSRHPFAVEEEMEHPYPPEEGWHCGHCGSVDHTTGQHEEEGL